MLATTRLPGQPFYTRHSRIGTVLFLLAGGLLAQDQPPAVPAGELRPGLRVQALSVYLGRYGLPPSGVENGTPSAGVSLLMGGGTAAVGWLAVGRRTQASLDYSVGYNRTDGSDSANGFDHAASFLVHTNRTERTALTFLAAAESRLMTSILLGRTAGTGAVTPESEEPGTDPAGVASDSPLDVIVSGARRTSGSLRAGLTHSHTPRLASTFSIGVGRVLRSGSRETEIAEHYPSLTSGIASYGLTYSLTRRMALTGRGGYVRSYSRLQRTHWGLAALGVRREIGRRSFGHAEGGYERMDELGTDRPARSSYSAAVGFGTAKGHHTFEASLRRGLTNSYGLDAGSRIAVGGTWGWARPTLPWSVAAGCAYERLDLREQRPFEARIYRFNLARLLRPHLRLAFDAAYISEVGRRSVDLRGRGVRVSLVWVPGPEGGGIR